MFLSNVRLMATGEWAGRFSHLSGRFPALEQFYLAWPALILWCPRRRLFPLALGAFLLGVFYNVVCAVLDLPVFWWFAPPLSMLPALGAGALLSLCMAGMPGQAAARVQWWAGNVFSPLFLALVAGKFFGVVPPGFSIFIGPVSSLAFIHFIRLAMDAPRRGGVAGRIFGNAALAHVGRMSYSIFLLHDFTELLLQRLPVLQPVLHSGFRVALLDPLHGVLLSRTFRGNLSRNRCFRCAGNSAWAPPGRAW